MERYVLQNSAQEFEQVFGVTVTSESQIEQTFNAAPGHVLPVITFKHGAAHIDSCIWNNELPSQSIFDALNDSGTLTALRKAACIVPISGFYLWKQTVNDPLPFYVRIHSQTILGVPGYFSGKAKSRNKFTVLTCIANVLLQPLDAYMPCLLEPNQFDDWLGDKTIELANTGFAQDVLIPDMTVFRVPNLVNELSNNSPELIQPIPKLREES